MSARQRCSERGCRHAPTAHFAEGCSLCGCKAWLDVLPHHWRRDVTDAWFLATLTWLTRLEAASNGWDAEAAEFEEHHPRPRLAAFMSAMSPGTPPEQLETLMAVDACDACQGTGHRHQEAP